MGGLFVIWNQKIQENTEKTAKNSEKAEVIHSFCTKTLVNTKFICYTLSRVK